MELKEVFTYLGTIIAISIAIFVFLLPKVVEMHRIRWKSMLNLDMPNDIRNSKKFRTGIFFDAIGMYTIAFASLGFGIYLTGILANAVSDFYGISQPFSFLSLTPTTIVGSIKVFFIILSATFTVSLLWLMAGNSINNRWPIIIKAYIEMTLDITRSKGVREELLDASKVFIKNGEYNDAILHSVTALEYELRKKLNIDSNKSFSTVMSRLINSGLKWVSNKEINDLVIMRKNIARENNPIKYVEQEAKEALEFVERMLRQLDELGVSNIYL